MLVAALATSADGNGGSSPWAAAVGFGVVAVGVALVQWRRQRRRRSGLWRHQPDR
jgi:hypothetical protein